MFNKKIPVKVIKVKLLKNIKQFSLWQLILFTIIFASVGGYVIYKSSALICACGGGVPPSAPTGLTTNTFDDNEVDLSWTASTSSYGVSGYHIYRNNSLIGTTSSPSFDSTGLASATKYSYFVTAYNAYGVSGSSNAATGGTYSTNPLTVPANFTAHVTSASTVNLNWNASTIEQLPLQEYDIYEFSLSGGIDADSYHDGQFIAATTNIYYTVTGLSASTSYGFYAIAVDTSGNTSDPSDQALATTNAAGYNTNVSVTATAYNVPNGQIIALICSTTGSNLICTKTFDPNSDSTDPNWTGTVASNTTSSQFLYPPNTTADYITYYYELSCSNGVSTAMSGILVTVAPTTNTTVFQTSLNNSLSESGDSTTTTVKHLNSAYKDPLRGVRRNAGLIWSFQPTRTDAGVDYWGVGPVYAVGKGTVKTYIKNVSNGGWAWGSHFIAYQLDPNATDSSGNKLAADGLWIYVAEACRLNPNLHVGSLVDSSTKLCTMYKVSKSRSHPEGGIETGWATQNGQASALAISLGAGSTNCYYYRRSPYTGQTFKDVGHTPYGRNFSHFMAAINPEDAASNGYKPRTQCGQPALTAAYNYKWLP
jgi:chitodextrinase